MSHHYKISNKSTNCRKIRMYSFKPCFVEYIDFKIMCYFLSLTIINNFIMFFYRVIYDFQQHWLISVNFYTLDFYTLFHCILLSFHISNSKNDLWVISINLCKCILTGHKSFLKFFELSDLLTGTYLLLIIIINNNYSK